jgi:hypothetical protein
VLLFLAGLGAYGILRAGIGVTDTHILIRSALGSTRAVPWQDVTGFAVTGSGRGRAFRVLGQGRQRWNTVGCSPTGWNRQEDELARWRLTRALEDERLARNPGAASEVPSCPPEPVRLSWARRWGQRLFIDTILVGFLGLSVWLAWSAAANVGLTFRAAGGAGTPGYFIPQSKTCDKSCWWYGEFRLPDGRVARTSVTIADTPYRDLQAGTPVAATDVGDDDTSNGGSGVVFPAHDPGAWSSTVTDLVRSAGWAAMLLSFLLGQVLRRARRPARRHLRTENRWLAGLASAYITDVMPRARLLAWLRRAEPADAPPEAGDEITAELTANYWAAYDTRMTSVGLIDVARQFPGLVGHRRHGRGVASEQDRGDRTRPRELAADRPAQHHDGPRARP